MTLIDASETGGSAAPCSVCGDPTTMRVEVGDGGRAPMCSRFCEHAWPNVKRLLEEIVTLREEGEAERAALVHIMLDIEEWKVEKQGAWTTIASIEKRVKKVMNMRATESERPEQEK